MRHLIVMATLTILSGCGQTGPLYLPEQAPAAGPQETTSVTPDESTP